MSVDEEWNFFVYQGSFLRRDFLIHLAHVLTFEMEVSCRENWLVAIVQSHGLHQSKDYLTLELDSWQSDKENCFFYSCLWYLLEK